MYLGLHIKYPLFLSDINETWNVLDRFSKNTEIKNFMKLHPMGAELFREDERKNGQANKTKGNNRSPKIHLCVLCGSHNKQRLLIVILITNEECVFCAVRT